MRPRPAGGLDRPPRRGGRRAHAGRTGPLSRHRQNPAREEHPRHRHGRLPRGGGRTGLHPARRESARHAHPGPVRPAGGGAGGQGHHHGLPLGRRAGGRPRRRQPRADRRGGHVPAPGRHAAARRPAPDRQLGRQDRQGARYRRRADRQRRLARSRPQPHVLCRRRHLAGDRQAAHGAHRLSAAHHARLQHADQGSDRVLRGHPQGQEAVLHARHGGRLQAAARGAALWRHGAGAPAQEAGALRGALLGVRHPRGPASTA